MGTNSPSHQRILTVDLEDWFHLIDYGGSADVEGWHRYPSRIQENTAFLLDCFREAGVKATFFSLGWIARNHPGLIQDILREGHEIGSHSDVHEMVRKQSPSGFRSDLRASIRAIEDASGQPVRFFRAPGFSITPECLWAFDILLEEGITCDCSVFPGSHAHGGFAQIIPDGPVRLRASAGVLHELPVTTRRIWGTQMAFGGGGYFRLLPGALIRYWAQRSPYLMTYFHPRDFDPSQPVLPGLPATRRFKSYVGLARSRSKLKSLLAMGGFCTVSAAHDRIDWERVPMIETLAGTESR